MTIYSDIQKNVTDFRNAQDSYWKLLPSMLISFNSDLNNYLDVNYKMLQRKDGLETPVVVVGLIEGDGNVKQVPPLKFKRDDANLSLNFEVQVFFAKEYSEIVDGNLIFNCHFKKRNGDYIFTITDSDFICPQKTSNMRELDFSNVFKYIESRLYQHYDVSIFK